MHIVEASRAGEFKGRGQGHLLLNLDAIAYVEAGSITNTVHFVGGGSIGVKGLGWAGRESAFLNDLRCSQNEAQDWEENDREQDDQMDTPNLRDPRTIRVGTELHNRLSELLVTERELAVGEAAGLVKDTLHEHVLDHSQTWPTKLVMAILKLKSKPVVRNAEEECTCDGPRTGTNPNCLVHGDVEKVVHFEDANPVHWECGATTHDDEMHVCNHPGCCVVNFPVEQSSGTPTRDEGANDPVGIEREACDITDVLMGQCSRDVYRAPGCTCANCSTARKIVRLVEAQRPVIGSMKLHTIRFRAKNVAEEVLETLGGACTDPDNLSPCECAYCKAVQNIVGFVVDILQENIVTVDDGEDMREVLTGGPKCTCDQMLSGKLCAECLKAQERSY